ncbi:glycine hydroxymethyltransferase [Pseudomonas sp. 5P_3.1_Bac2]|uniref:glycine hydroxymethyltransferase n=1 Tax=Pseudomonas sp. 5P_3.1_Bac2 TaxID=2971617 RepID=UPI0021C6106B|nr:glycine hydroxymethyltransferase [Pseudomonas sp. 5P_3.1_Bac2]MCU1718207.1 glycine hydroxymethyltransferase [Pseudomonas sp. 5P_3.1_Bac2]
METPNELQLLTQAAARGEALRDGRVILYAGANLPSPQAQAAYAPELSAYPAMGPSFAKEQPDTDLVSGLEVAVRRRICRLFKAAWAEPRLPSCTIANLAVFHAFSRPGDLLLAPAAAHGGHLSQRRGGTPELAGLRVVDLPYDSQVCRLDTQAAAQQVRALRPNLIMLGRSVIITPDDLEAVVEAAQEVGAKTIYDASHVSGLIAGGCFPNPLEMGVDILTSSTYKTLPGRPHSLIAGRDPADGERLAGFIDRALLANYDAGKLPAFLVTLQQAEADGGAYARRVCAATELFAQLLREQDVAVIAPEAGGIFTHQVLVPMSPSVAPAQAMHALQRQGILLGTCADPRTPGGYALRVGTQYIVAQGQDSEVAAIACRLAGSLRRAPDGRMLVG